MTSKRVPLDQAWSKRRAHMEKILGNNFEKPISMLEIGTWFGVGSTQIWLENLRQNSSLTVIDAWKAYGSQRDLQDKAWDWHQVDGMAADAFLSTYVNLKKFEHENEEKNISVNMIRGGAKEFLPMMASNVFDFIYIDGDHKYENVKSDIVQAKRLIKSDFGIICGDDLERNPSAELIDYAKNHKDIDYVRDGDLRFHPGVLLAVAEEFGAVNMSDGFWWIYCINGNFIVSK